MTARFPYDSGMDRLVRTARRGFPGTVGGRLRSATPGGLDTRSMASLSTAAGNPTMHYQESLTVATVPVPPWTLTFLPLPQWPDLSVNGIVYPPSAQTWTIDGQIVTFAAGLLAPGDVVWCHYECLPHELPTLEWTDPVDITYMGRGVYDYEDGTTTANYWGSQEILASRAGDAVVLGWLQDYGSETAGQSQVVVTRAVRAGKPPTFGDPLELTTNAHGGPIGSGAQFPVSDSRVIFCWPMFFYDPVAAGNPYLYLACVEASGLSVTKVWDATLVPDPAGTDARPYGWVDHDTGQLRLVVDDHHGKGYWYVLDLDTGAVADQQTFTPTWGTAQVGFIGRGAVATRFQRNGSGPSAFTSLYLSPGMTDTGAETAPTAPYDYTMRTTTPARHTGTGNLGGFAPALGTDAAAWRAGRLADHYVSLQRLADPSYSGGVPYAPGNIPTVVDVAVGADGTLSVARAKQIPRGTWNGDAAAAYTEGQIPQLAPAMGGSGPSTAGLEGPDGKIHALYTVYEPFGITSDVRAVAVIDLEGDAVEVEGKPNLWADLVPIQSGSCTLNGDVSAAGLAAAWTRPVVDSAAHFDFPVYLTTIPMG